MPRLERPDGIELHWEERGEGPLVVLSPHATGLPEVFDPLIDQLASDHRVVRYDARGTGRSTRSGPHDMETGAGDLLGVIDATGGPAVVVGIADACNRAARGAALQPDACVAVIGLAGAPIAIEAFAGTDSIIASGTAVEAFREMIATNYKGAIRSLLTRANPQMSEDELRTRVKRQAEYCNREVAVERLNAWSATTPTTPGGPSAIGCGCCSPTTWDAPGSRAPPR